MEYIPHLQCIQDCFHGWETREGVICTSSLIIPVCALLSWRELSAPYKVLKRDAQLAEDAIADQQLCP